MDPIVVLEAFNKFIGLLGLGVKRVTSIDEAVALAKTLPDPTPLPDSGNADADWAAAQAEKEHAKPKV